MTELRDYIEQRLTALYQAKLDENGWWCHRCDSPAWPLTEDGPGWCGICGLDPRVEGPGRPWQPRGIEQLWEPA